MIRILSHYFLICAFLFQNIPHMFVTNSGGMTEAHKAEQLKKSLGIYVRKFKRKKILLTLSKKYVKEDQVILSASPLKELDHLKNEKVLIVGARRDWSLKVAQNYGFSSSVRETVFILFL